jgi:putative FmdB family regulatory protein
LDVKTVKIKGFSRGAGAIASHFRPASAAAGLAITTEDRVPIYAYRCESCGFEKDALQKMSDAPLTVCPQCGQPALKKQVTAAGFQLKGSGWYVTDFRDGGQKQKAGDKAAAPAAESKPGDTPAKTGEGSVAASDKAATPSDSKAAPSAPAAAPAASSSAPAAASSAPAAKSSGGGSTS